MRRLSTDSESTFQALSEYPYPVSSASSLAEIINIQQILNIIIGMKSQQWRAAFLLPRVSYVGPMGWHLSRIGARV